MSLHPGKQALEINFVFHSLTHSLAVIRPGLKHRVRIQAQGKVALAFADVTSTGLKMHFRICQCRDTAHGPVSTPSVNNLKRRDDCMAVATLLIDKTGWQTDPRTGRRTSGSGASK